MSDEPFTGERLHEGAPGFALDLARHRAAYEYARGALPGGRWLDLGCGSGHGAALLAGSAPRGAVVGVDRVAPDRASRASGARFCRADLDALPLRPGSFTGVASFQVIEHLEDPGPYLDRIASLLTPEGVALLSTPNRQLSDGVNPYHVHEYLADELASLLRRHFAEVELFGVGATAPVRRALEARSRRIRRLLCLDPLRLRERLPRAWLFALFALGARLVRRGGGGEDAPAATWRDFPVGPPDETTSLDWLAVCRRPHSPVQIARRSSSPTTG